MKSLATYALSALLLCSCVTAADDPSEGSSQAIQGSVAFEQAKVIHKAFLAAPAEAFRPITLGECPSAAQEKARVEASSQNAKFVSASVLTTPVGDVVVLELTIPLEASSGLIQNYTSLSLYDAAGALRVSGWGRTFDERLSWMAHFAGAVWTILQQ